MGWPRTLADAIDVAVAVAPDSVAVVDAHEQLTYAELDRRADGCAQWLAAHGVRAADRVAVATGNECGFVVALLGVWRAGAIAALPNTRVPVAQIADVIHDSGAPMLLRNDMFAALDAALPDITAAIISALPQSASGTLPPRPAPDDVAMQPYTSGSTGRPKGVLLTHAGQLHNAATMAATGLQTPDDVALVSGPAFHANALAGLVLPTLCSGGTLVFLPVFEPEAVASAVAAHRVTQLTGVPAMYRMLLDSGALSRHDVTSLKVLLCGSAPVTAELLADLEAAAPGVAVIEGYGLTEGGPVVTRCPLFGPRKLGSIGLPIPGVEVQIDGESEDGELLVRGPGVMLGYHNRPDATAEKLGPDGWLRTGDRVRRDGGGWYYFLGRVDDMLNVGGENLYPVEVENRIREVTAVADVVVVPAPHPIKGQVPVAFVVPRPGQSTSEDEIRQHCLDTGPAYAHPRRVVVLDALPLASTGKVDRAVLARSAADLLPASQGV